MCGIVAYIGPRENAAQIVFQGLKKLEYRGYDSWGVAVKPLKGKTIKIEKHIGKIGQAKINLPVSSLALGHTRWATHGGVTNKNAHPHLDCQKRIVVVHNGIVENYQSLREKLKSQGHIFQSETDTEVIAHLIEEKLKTQNPVKAVFTSFKSLVGSNAIVVLDVKSEQIVACRDGSPLVAGLGDKEYFLASDVTPFLPYTQKAIFINDRQGAVLNKKGIKIYDLDRGKEKKVQPRLINWQIEDVQKSGYPHFLLKEIMEQKNTISQTSQLNQKTISQIAQEIKKGAQVMLTGCGTAYHCSLAGKYFLAQAQVLAQAYGAYEALPFLEFCNKKTILIAISQSGETADTLIAAKIAKKKGAKIVAVVNAVGSSLERLADFVLTIGAGPEIAVVSTKAFTAQLATLYLLAGAVGGHYAKTQKQVSNLKPVLTRWLNQKLEKQIIILAKKLKDHQDIYLIGKGLNYPAVMEFALKIKETSYIHSEAFASGELKHGVISLIQKGTPCIALVAKEKELRREVLSSATELKSRGAMIVGVSPLQAPEFDYFIKTPDLADLTMITDIIVGQLLGYYLGVGRGCDPDKPRNLAKSVTVK